MNRNLSLRLAVVVLVVAGLILAACTTTGGETESTGSGYTDITWEWVSVDSTMTGGEKVTVPNPENYTIVFREDGTINGLADCNSFGGTYTQGEGGDFDIELGATTMMACPEGSLDAQYMTLLSNVAAAGPDGSGGFAMTGAGGVDYMLFRDGGPAASE